MDQSSQTKMIEKLSELKDINELKEIVQGELPSLNITELTQELLNLYKQRTNKDNGVPKELRIKNELMTNDWFTIPILEEMNYFGNGNGAKVNGYQLARGI